MTASATKYIRELDVTPRHLAKKGIAIVRIRGIDKYPRNGNLGNPTPTYRWHVSFRGVYQGGAGSMAGAKALVDECLSA